jgi:signal transduction histidine kinase
LSVQDSGPGIPLESRTVVFERFRQADGAATREHGGTGLGLSIARDFLDLHGGHIGVTDAPGGGALFQAQLPLRAPEGTPVRRLRDPGEVRRQALAGGSGLDGVLEELTRSGSSSDPSEEEDAPDDGRPTILVVEDNPELRRFVRRGLEGRFRVLAAADGQEGLEKARAESPDVVVTDLMMPRLSGDALAAALREDPGTRDIPILVLSAKADDALRLRLLRDAVQDYLVKPFSSEELAARVANLAAVKRARDVLRAEVQGQQRDLEALAREMAGRNRELRHAMEATRLALARAEAASTAQGDFLRLVSHELRSPLTSVVLHLDLLRRVGGDGWSPRQTDLLGRMDTASRRLVEVVGAVLDQTRIAGLRAPLDLQPLDPGSLAREVASEIAPLAQGKGLRLAVDAGDAPTLRSDPRLLRLVFRHLLDNAVKFTDAGEVRLRLDRDGDAVRIAVSDSGRGIAPEEQTRIFEPFREGGDVRHKHEAGLGLGLAIVRQAAEALGARLDLDSGVGRGTTVTLTLPLDTAAEAA